MTSYFPATPVPLKLMVEVAPVEELLVSVSFPLAAPGAVGSNSIWSVVVCFGLRVSGKLIPNNVKPAPVVDPALIVRGALPEEVKVTDW